MNDMQPYKKKPIILICIIAALILIAFSWYYIEKASKDKNFNPLSLDTQDIQRLKVSEEPLIHIQTHIEENGDSNNLAHANMEINPCYNANSSIYYDLQSKTPSTEPKQNTDSNSWHLRSSKNSHTDSKKELTTSTSKTLTHDRKNDTNLNPTKNGDKITALYTKNSKRFYKKPKVVIIIDDLANKKDIKNFQSLHLKLTLSLFPKQFFSKNNPDIAKTLEFYMIHLPLEAHNFEQQGVVNLRIGDSLQTIESHITQIKKDFPKLAYINNHTGSRYTESREDMQKLLQVLARHNITFIDSLTTSKSVVGKLLKEQNKIHIARNVFLDNEVNINAIAKQLNTALKIADNQGYVIAIGHPKQATYQVLQAYREILLKDYEMLYINELDLLLQKHNISDTKTPLPLLE